MAACSAQPSKGITYPREWGDKDRMSYLLAPFPPSDRPLCLEDPKLSFWSSFVLSSSKELRKIVVSVRDLQERFRWNGQTSPGCISEVLQSMEKTGQIMKLADFYTMEQSWFSWGANMVKTWALPYFQAHKYEGEYVINCMAKECAETVLSQHKGAALYKSTDNVMRKEEFERLCLGAVSGEEVPILAQQLTRSEHLVTAGTEFGYEVVKLSPVKAKGLKVIDVDIGIVRIKETIVNLSAQIKVLEEAIIRFKISAKDKVKEKDKKGALRVLRHSRAKKALLDSKESMLDNVQDILHKIQGAETDAMVYAAYKSGVEALGFLRTSEGLTLEAVEDVQDELHQLVEEGEEIAAVLGEGPAGDKEEEDQLLRELEGLMDQEPEMDALELDMAKLSVKEDEGGVGHLLEHLPPVPTGAIPTPSTADRTKKQRPLLET